jgi:hypothetical protein
LDVDRDSIEIITINQWLNLISHLPRYSISKIKPTEYFVKENPEIGIYERKSFNSYGDVYVHWAHKHADFPPYGFDKVEGRLNRQLINEIIEFENELNDKGAILFITFPCLQEATYQVYEPQIIILEKELSARGFQILGSPSRYKMPELFMYNTPYHLNREGVEYRTNLLIEDLRLAGVGSQE